MATYYIDPSGNDTTGTGAIGFPWKTLYKATSVVTTSGDIIHINAGTYLETQQVVLAAGVSIEGHSKTDTIIKSTVNTVYVEMINMRSPENTNGNQHITGIKIDGQYSTYALIRIGGRSNVSIHDCDFVNSQIMGVTFAVHNSDDNDPGFPTNYALNNSFYNNTMSNCGNWFASNGNGYGALQIGGQKDMLIYGNTIIQNNTCYNNGWPIKYWQGGYNVGCRIYNNYLQAAPQCFALGDLNWDFAIEMFNCTGMEIDHNTIVNGCVDFNNSSTTGFGLGGSFIVGPYAYSLWMHDNNVYMQTANTHVQTGVTLEFSVDQVIIENNTFDKFNIGVLYTPRPGYTISNVRVNNNLFTDMTLGEGSEGYFIDHRVYSGTNLTFNNLEYYNNTFIASATAPVLHGIVLPSTTSGGTLSNIKIKNNIINGSINAPIEVLEGSVAITNLDIQYNDIYGCGNSNLPSYTVAPGTGYTFANNVNVLPAFGGSNHSLVNTSPLIDAGVNVGLPFTGSAPNINWVETTAPAAPIVNAGADQLITLPSTPTLTGTVTPGSGATIVSTVWTQISGATCTITTPTSTTTTITGLTNNSVFRLTATDDFSAVVYDEIILIVANPGGCPTLDPTHAGSGSTLTGGNLTVALNNCTVLATMPMVGKKYFEVTVNSSPYFTTFGVANTNVDLTHLTGNDAYGWALYVNNFGSPSQDSFHNGAGGHINSNPLNIGDIIGIAYDSTTGTMIAYRNNVLIGTVFTGITGTVFPAVGSSTYNSTSLTLNFGATTFAYTPPTGYSSLCGSGGGNIPPVSNAGIDQVITLPTSSITFAGSGSDSDGTVASHTWSQVSGPNTATITTPSSYTSTATGLIAGTYVFRLTVVDNLSVPTTDDMTVTVNNISGTTFIKRRITILP